MENADCSDTEGSYECICSSGYSGDGLVNCESESLQMHPRCQHTSTSMISVCIQGHAKGKLMCPCGLFLPDVNECTEDTHMCDDVAMCSDTVGSYTCTCITGYTGFTCNGNHTERQMDMSYHLKFYLNLSQTLMSVKMALMAVMRTQSALTLMAATLVPALQDTVEMALSVTVGLPCTF